MNTENKSVTDLITGLTSSQNFNKVLDKAIVDLSSKESLSLSTLLKSAQFVLINPGRIFTAANVFKTADFSDIHLQKDLLATDQIWDFLKKRADDLPQIGQILAKNGFKEFEEGNILDKQGLMILKESFKNEKTLNVIKEIALETRNNVPDWNNVASKTLEMLTTHESFTKYFEQKGKAIGDYIQNSMINITTDDHIKTFDNILQNDSRNTKYKIVKELFKNDDFKHRVAKEHFPNIIMNLPKIKKLSNTEQQDFKEFLQASLIQTRPFLEPYLEPYNIDFRVADMVPALLNNIVKVKDIYDTLNDTGVMTAAEKALDMVIGDKTLKKFFENNPEFLPNLGKGIINNNPSLQSLTSDYKLDTATFDIVGDLISKPEFAKNIIKNVNEQDYINLTKNLIDGLNTPGINLKNTLRTQSKLGLFDNLIEGVIDQDIKSIEKSGRSINDSIQVNLAKYGIETKDLSKITKIFPLLIDEPKSLQNIFNHFTQNEYLQIAKELISLTEHKPEIKEYLTSNRDLFVGVLNHVVMDVPALKSLNIKGELYDIVPKLLEQPKDLLNIIDAYETGNYLKITKDFTNLAIKTGAFKGNLSNIANVAIGSAKTYASAKFSGLFSSFKTTSGNQQIKEALSQDVKKEIADITKVLQGQITNVQGDSSTKSPANTRSRDTKKYYIEID